MPAEQLRFQNATELDENDTWSAILGSTGVRWRPATGALPEVLSVPAGMTQYWGKAYPAGRHLEVLKGLGPNGIVASICARNTSDQTAADFGYRPAVAALIERIRTQLP